MLVCVKVSTGERHLLPQQCPAWLVRLIWRDFEIGGRWSYSCCFVGFFFQNFFRIARSILVKLPSSYKLSVYVVYPYNRIDSTAAWKKMCFILSDKCDFYMIDSLSTADHAFACHVLMSFSVDETLLPRLVNLSISIRELPFSWDMSPLWFWLKPIYFDLSALIRRPLLCAAFSRLCRRDSAWAGAFVSSAMSSVQSASIIVRVGYCLLLEFSSVRPFSFNKSTYAQSTKSWQIINKYGVNVSLWSTTATMSKKSISPFGERIFIFVFL